NSLSDKGFINGFEGNYMPSADITRAEVVTIFDNIIVKYIYKAGTYDGNIEGITVIAANNVVLKNGSVNGDIIIAPGASGSVIELNGVNAKQNIIIQAPVTLNLKNESTVDSVTVENNADGTVINVEKNSVIKAAVSWADKVTFDGKGTVSKAEINGNNNAVNTQGTDITEGSNVTGTTVNGKPLGENTESSGGSGGGGGVSTELQNARTALQQQIDAAGAFMESEQLLADWKVLADEVTAAEDVVKNGGLQTVKDHTAALQDLLDLADELNSKNNTAKALTADNFAAEEDFTTLTSALAATAALSETSTQAEVQAVVDNLSAAMAKATVEAAELTGNTVTNNWEVNENGIKIEISLNGYSFNDDVAAHKQEIVDAIDFYGWKYDKAEHQYNQIPIADFITQCMDNYNGPGYFAVLEGRVSVYDRFVGLNPKGARSVVLDQDLIDDPTLTDRYPGVEAGIRKALVEEAAFTVNEQGNLVISCNNKGYFKDFCNQVPVCNGGVQIVCADVMMNFTMPASVVKEGINVSSVVSDVYQIMEMKMHAEVWEYTTEAETLDGNGEIKDGYFSFDQSIQSEDRNATARQYDTIYYLKQVTDNLLTEEDIRKGGTAGPNGTGDKLIKICIDTRVGPAQWASIKDNKQFITNFFRTSADATDYSASADSYAPADDEQWQKIENKLVETHVNDVQGYRLSNLIYAVNYSGDSRADVTNPQPMWMFFELPKTVDFNIDQNMNLYLNTIAGMFGGSGQSESTGMPILGMDGRYFMQITATDDSDL
ncbi:MAG: hypothetical protein ACOX7J_08150, partial [Bacillota bacterium]